MAADMSLLRQDFAAKVITVLERCKAQGFDMRANAGMRGPVEQAKLWRQSRSIEEITVMIHKLENAGAGFLAECIREAGPQHGDHVTDAPPGFSWHQWGEAVDAFWLVDGKAEWSTKKLVGGRNAYQVYAAEGAAAGLTAGGLWPKFKDWPHLQWRKASSPLKEKLTPAQISAEMEQRFGG